MAPQPMKESCLLTSELEKTNEAYALAKISGLKYCEFLNRQYGTDYISVMPTNLYGPNDNYHPTHSHVLPALIRRFHEAKEQNLPYVTCWGDGSPLREFLYVDDLANLCVFLMNNYSGNETVNAGTGKELERSAGIRQNRTEPPESCSIYPRARQWAGSRKHRLMKASGLPTMIS